MPATHSVDPATVARVLLIRPRYLGDVCLTLPLLDSVRKNVPQARIAYMVESESAALLAGDKRIDELIVVPRKPRFKETLRLIWQLWRFRPHLTLDCFCNPRTAIWTMLSLAGTRVGYPNKGWRSWMYTHHVQPRTLSAIGFHLASLTAIGWRTQEDVPKLHVGEDALKEANEELQQMGVRAGARLIGFHPGARWQTRRWDPPRFAALAKRMLEDDAEAVALVTGGPGDLEVVRAVLRRLPRGRAFAIVGWPIHRFVALQSRCAAFVCGDTGPLHTAVAAGAPTLGLMSRNRPAMFFPYPEAQGHRAYYARVECSPCHRDECEDLRCLDRLTVDGAWAMLKEMLAREQLTALQR